MLKSKSVFLWVLLALSFNYAMAADNPDFKLSGEQRNVTAIVPEKSLEFNATVGNSTDYSKIDGEEKNFVLTIGGCFVNVSGYVAKNQITYAITGLGESMNIIPELNSISVSSDGFIFTGRNTGQAKCNATFGEKQGDGNYHVSVSLSGDVPAGFGLSSTKIKMENPAESSEPAPDASNAGPAAGAIAGIIMGVLGVLLISGSIGGFIFYRVRKNKALQKDLHRKKGVIPKSAESVLPADIKTAEEKKKSSEPKPSNSKKESLTPNDSKKELPAPNGSKKELPAPTPKENNDKKKGLSKEKKELPNEKKKASPKAKSVEKPVENKEKSKETKEASVKETPAKEEPAKEASVNEAPVNEAPVNEEPAKEEPAKEEPAKEEPAKEEPAKEEPAKEEPAKQEPAKDKPKVKKHKKPPIMTRWGPLVQSDSEDSPPPADKNKENTAKEG